MANQITLGATLLFDGGDGTGGQPDDLVGTATGLTDTSTYLQGATSYTYSASNTRSGMLYDAGTAQNWANSVFYITVNSGVTGLLDTEANGGFRIRFCGATVTDFFEVNVGGNNNWPVSIQGGWVTFVVDIEQAKADTGRITGGTEPATSAIRYVGFSQILTVMPKMADNTWFDTVYRLPQNTAAIIVEGRNAGTTDWNAADILTQLGSGQMFYYAGPGGSYVLQGPIQFGINDTTTHGFTATNATWLWQNQKYVPDGFYGLSALGNSGGTTNVTLGVKSGTGDDATGAQGLVIQSASAGPRWFMDFDDPNLDSIDLYGCSFQHFGDFQLDDAAVECISNLYIDGSSATISNSLQLRNKIINAATADGVAFMTTDDLGDIRFCEFAFSDGHAIELTTPRVATQTSKGNKFTSYGATASNDAAVYNNTAGAVTINVTDSGDSPTYRNGTSASTTVNSAVNVSLGGVSRGTPVKFIANETVGTVTKGDTLATGFADSSGGFSYSQNYEAAFNPSGLDVLVVARNQGVATACIAEDNGTGFTDETSEGSSNTTADMTLLPATIAVNDAYYFGHQEQFSQLRLDISTAFVGTSLTILWEYWSGSGWSSLPSVTDGTNNFGNTGANIVSWAVPGSWATTSVTGQVNTGALYYVRARVTAVSGATTSPVGKKVQLDTTRYLPYSAERIITSTGLTDNASWQEDAISKFTQ